MSDAWDYALAQARDEFRQQGLPLKLERGNELHLRAHQIYTEGTTPVELFQSPLDTDTDDGSASVDSGFGEEAPMSYSESSGEDEVEEEVEDAAFTEAMYGLPKVMRDRYLQTFGSKFVRSPAQAAELLERLAEDKSVIRRRGPLTHVPVERRAPRIKASK